MLRFLYRTYQIVGAIRWYPGTTTYARTLWNFDVVGILQSDRTRRSQIPKALTDLHLTTSRTNESSSAFNTEQCPKNEPRRKSKSNLSQKHISVVRVNPHIKLTNSLPTPHTKPSHLESSLLLLFMSTLDLHAHDIRRLFDKDNLNRQDDRGYTCLHWLVVTGNNRLLRSLLEHYHGDNVLQPELRDNMSLTALDRACQLGRLHMARTIVRAFPDMIHNSRTSDGRSPLHFANESLQPSTMVTCLLELGADVNVATRMGRTILHESILRGYSTDHIQYLIAYGANLHARDVHGWTPLHYAAYMGHADIVEQLLLYGANPGATDVQGRTPLHITASKVVLQEWDQDIVTASHDLASNAVCSPELKQTHEWARNFGRRTPADIARLLLQHGARTWEMDATQNLTFSVAAQAGEVDVSYEIVRVAAMEGLFG